MPKWIAISKREEVHSLLVISGGVLVVLFLLGIGAVVVTTLVVVVRGGRGPGSPPASHPVADRGGFPVLAPPRGVFERPR